MAGRPKTLVSERTSFRTNDPAPIVEPQPTIILFIIVVPVCMVADSCKRKYFSLSTAKIVGAGQERFITTDDYELGPRLKELQLHGNESIFAPTWKQLGFNFRLTYIHAAIAITQLHKLEERRTSVTYVQDLYLRELLEQDFGVINTVDFASGALGPYVEFILADPNKRSSLNQFTASKGIEVRPFYPSLI